MSLARDEREREIDLRADRAAYMVVTYGLLVLVMARAVLRNEGAWDLMALVMIGGAVNLGYTAWKRAVSRQMVALTISIGVLAAVVAGVIAFATRLI
jgi:hypothetical protein